MTSDPGDFHLSRRSTPSPLMTLLDPAGPVELPSDLRGGAVAVGNFDGVHLGHAALVAELCRLARDVKGPAVVVTFDPHPLQVLAPERFQPPLTTLERRCQLLREQGADGVLVLRTSPELLQFSPETFFHEIIRQRLQAHALVEGFNFRFGRDRAGDNELLRHLCAEAGMAFQIVPPRTLAGETVSSSRVRDTLTSGDVTAATRWLGRAYRLSGRVVEGQRRGRTLGFPTANVAEVPTLIPAESVYAGWVRHAERRYPAAVNVGPNPTFGEQERKIEAYLLGFSGDLYGQMIDIDFVRRLRATRPFTGVEELLAQIHRDVEQVQEMAQEASNSDQSYVP